MDKNYRGNATFAPGSTRQKYGSYDNNVGLCVGAAIHISSYSEGGQGLFGLYLLEKRPDVWNLV